MNVLITNTQEDQAYLILRCLQPEVSRIFVTISGDRFVQRWVGMSVWSRYVSKRYRVPDCSTDWQAGVICAENTAGEERYIQRIEEICAAAGIDVIFPSYDAEVYVFSKNKSRFASQGIVTVVPEYAALTRILDKSLTLQAAQAVGFPTPASYVPLDREELLTAVNGLAPPWILKPRCNAHGANIRLSRDLPELEAAFCELSAIQQRPLLQEYVPAQTKRNYYLLVSPGLKVVSLFSPSVHRLRRVGVRAPCAAVETTTEVPFAQEVQALVRELGIWGAMTVQTIVDERDGIPKLMEINPRFGHNLWYRTEFGINEPLMYLLLAQGREIDAVPAFPEGVLLLDPLRDILHLLGQCLDQGKIWLRTRFQGREVSAKPYKVDSILHLLWDFQFEYFRRKRRVTSPLNRGYFSDPLPPLARIGRTLIEKIRDPSP